MTARGIGLGRELVFGFGAAVAGSRKCRAIAIA